MPKAVRLEQTKLEVRIALALAKFRGEVSKPIISAGLTGVWSEGCSHVFSPQCTGELTYEIKHH